MKVVIQIIILSFIVWVFPYYSYSQESNQALKAPPESQATVKGKEKVYSDKSTSIEEEIANLKGRINALEKVVEAGKLGWSDLLTFAGILTGMWIAVLATGFGLGGYAVYRQIRGETIGEVKISREDAVNDIKARLRLLQSLQSWYEYEPPSFQVTREEFYLNDAIMNAQAAKEYAEKIHEKQEYQKLILECYNHLAYHLTVRGNSDDVKRALPLVRELERKMPEFDRPPQWMDTISYVYYRFGNPAEKEKGLRLYEELISREKELGPDFVHAVKAKYELNK